SPRGRARTPRATGDPGGSRPARLRANRAGRPGGRRAGYPAPAGGHPRPDAAAPPPAAGAAATRRTAPAPAAGRRAARPRGGQGRPHPPATPSEAEPRPKSDYARYGTYVLSMSQGRELADAVVMPFAARRVG